MSTAIDVIKDAMQAQGLRLDTIQKQLDEMQKNGERGARAHELLRTNAKKSRNPAAYAALADLTRGDISMRMDETPEQFAQRATMENEVVTIGDGALKGKVQRKKIGAVLAVRMARLMRFGAQNGDQPSLDRAKRNAQSMGDEIMIKLYEEFDEIRNTAGLDQAQIERKMLERLGSSTIAAGGALVPIEFADEVIKLLTAASTVRRFPVKIMNLSAGQMLVPDARTGMTAAYDSENSGPNASEPTFGDIVLSSKILTSITPVSQELRNRASYDVDAILVDMAIRKAAEREDLAFIRGDGTANTPKGIKKWIDEYNSAQTFARTLSGGVPTTATIIADLGKAIRLVDDNNVPMEGCGWILPTREKYALLTLRDSVGGFLFRDEMAAGSLMGYEYCSTSQIPKTLAGDGSGTGTNNKSEVYFCAFAHAMIGEENGVEVEMIPNAAYSNSSGTLVSGAQRREDILRMVARHDFALSYRGLEASYISSVDWGA